MATRKLTYDGVTFEIDERDWDAYLEEASENLKEEIKEQRSSGYTAEDVYDQMGVSTRAEAVEKSALELAWQSTPEYAAEREQRVKDASAKREKFMGELLTCADCGVQGPRSSMTQAGFDGPAFCADCVAASVSGAMASMKPQRRRQLGQKMEPQLEEADEQDPPAPLERRRVTQRDLDLA